MSPFVDLQQLWAAARGLPPEGRLRADFKYEADFAISKGVHFLPQTP